MMPGHDQTHLIAAAASVASSAAAIVAHDQLAQQWLGVPLPVLLAAFAGATCALSFLATMGLARSLIALSVSTIAAGYMVPVVSWAFSVPSNLSIGLAFLLALFGQTGIGIAFGSLPEIARRLIDALIDRVRGRP